MSNDSTKVQIPHSLSKENRLNEELRHNLYKQLNTYEKLKDEIFPYYIWQRIPRCNLKLQELKPNYYHDVINLIDNYYLDEEPIHETLKMKEDQQSLNSFKLRILENLKDSSSLIALNEGNLNEIAGVLILVEVQRNYFPKIMSRTDIVEGHSHKKFVDLTSSTYNDFDIYATYGCFTFLRIYLICIHPKYRHMGIGRKLLETAVLVAQSLQIPLIMGIFTDSRVRVIAKKIGMEEIKNIKYSEWTDFENHRIFPDINDDNAYCSLMVGKVPNMNRSQTIVKIKN